MSVIYIVDHNETIYDVIKTRKKIPKKPPRYQNYLEADKLKNEGKAPCGTMGPAEYPPPDPKMFLRKQVKRYPRSGPFHRVCFTGTKHAPVPSSKIEKVKKEETKNFIEKNVNIAKTLKPKQPEAKFVDSRTGTVKKVENSGLEPCYVYSKTFGKPPFYMVQRNIASKRLVEIKQDKSDLKTLPKCRYVTRQERQKLLDGLKTNWEAMQKEYQLLPIITDTIPKIIRKSKMENELKELEKDIVLIEKHPFIYVLDED